MSAGTGGPAQGSREGQVESGERGRLLTGEHGLANAVGYGAGPQQQLQRRAHAAGPGGQASR